MWSETYGWFEAIANRLSRPNERSVPSSCPAQYGSVVLRGCQTAPMRTQNTSPGGRRGEDPLGPRQYTLPALRPSSAAAVSGTDAHHASPDLPSTGHAPEVTFTCA